MGTATRSTPYKITTQSAFAAGKVLQLPSGQAAIYDSSNGAAVGERITPFRRGPYTAPKAALQILDGDRLWWNWSSEVATPLPPLVAGRSFPLGTAIGDAAPGDPTCAFDVNELPSFLIDKNRDGGTTALVGGASLFNRGGSLVGSFSTATEAQKFDWLSRRSFSVDSRWILEGWLTIDTDADAAVVDVDVAIASATHASDLEAVAEFAAFNFAMGADLNIRAHSDDGTTDVPPTDTLVDWAVGTPVHLKIDGRNKSSLAFYVNCVRVLPGTTFSLAAASGPLKLLFMGEKSSDDTPGGVSLDDFTIRTAEQRG